MSLIPDLETEENTKFETDMSLSHFSKNGYQFFAVQKEKNKIFKIISFDLRNLQISNKIELNQPIQNFKIDPIGIFIFVNTGKLMIINAKGILYSKTKKLLEIKSFII